MAQQDLQLWYSSPAKQWTDALPIGNGRLGAMVFGKYDHERHFPIRFSALYWHFLDVVWVVMLGCFALAAYVSEIG